MKFQVQLAIFLIIILGSEWGTAYHPDFSWKNVDSLMNGDLRHRMNKKIPTRRRYCDCEEVTVEDSYAVCASNGALYTNACLFQCTKVRWPHLEPARMAKCGPETFIEFKMSEFRPHY